MKWLRLYHDTITDPKWRVVAAESGQSEAVVLAVWVHMLVNASAAKARGTLEGWDDRFVGAAMGLKGDVVAAVREAMQGVTLDGMRLTGWDKRQKASDNVAERVRRHRNNKSGSPAPGGGSGNGAAPHGNGTNGVGNGDVTLHSPGETEKHLSLSLTNTPVSSEIDEVEVCVAPAREEDTHTGASPDLVKTANIVPFAKPGSPEVLPLPDGWVLPEAWFDWAQGAGHPDPAAAGERFHTHWLGKRDRGDRDAANSEAVWLKHWQGWVRGDIKRERDHGQQRHAGRQRQDNGLTAYLKSEIGGNTGHAEGGPDDGGWRVVRG